ncbi:MAG: long-chain fatty acid--CoA ligase [Anaerolineales bacterium]|nr:long-chain fatty acid--CoA ligase [Anaerolineales bacterium]
MQLRPWLSQYDPQLSSSLAPYPAHGFHAFLEQSAARYPDRPCTLFKGRVVTYREMNAQADRLAAALAGLGVKKGDRVGLLIPNTPQFVIAFYGVLKAGAVVVATNPLYTPHEMEHQLRDAGVETVIVMSNFYGRINEVRDRTSIKRVIVTNLKEQLPAQLAVMFTLVKERKDGHRVDRLQPGDLWFKDLLARYRPDDRPVVEVTGDDIAIFQYSGGTTGVPKGAIALHRNLVANTIQNGAWIHVIREGESRTLMAIPLFHVYGMVAGMGLSISRACALIMVPNPRDIVDVLISIHKYQPQLFPAVPAMFNAISRHPDVVAGKYDLRSIRACISGSAPLLAEIKERFERVTGGTVVEGFGMSETPTATHCNPLAGTNKAGSIGLPYPDVEVRVVSLADGVSEVPPGEEGELVLRGPQVFAGYWNMPDETAITLRPDPNGQGGPWLYTGDIVRMDEDGYFYIVDRKKELIKAGGFQVWPREVEEVLIQHPAVREVAAAGVPDLDGNERVMAWVVLNEGAQVSEEELRQFARAELTGYKVPRHIGFRKELPRTTVGKLLRRKLVQEETERLRQPAAV